MILQPGLLLWQGPQNPAWATSVPLLLDNIPGAVAAYSLRRVRAGYAGFAAQIRRSSDNGLQNIGFVGNDFDTASFSSFIGGGSGFVQTWYDQSGTGNDATQATQANQPAILLAATPTPRPVVNSTALTQGMIHAGAAASTAALTFGACVNRTGNLGSYDLFVSYDGNAPGLTHVAGAAALTVGVANVGVIGNAAATDNAFHSAVGYCDGANNWGVAVDNGTPVTGVVTQSTGFTQIDLFSNSSGFGSIAQLAEGFIWSRKLTPTEITTLRNDHNGYYGTP